MFPNYQLGKGRAMGNIERREYANGTYLTVEYPFATYVAGRAMCPDGKVRNLKRISLCADTFFSIPASVTVKGKTVAGYVTDNDGTICFVPFEYCKNHVVFPDKTRRYDRVKIWQENRAKENAEFWNS